VRGESRLAFAPDGTFRYSFLDTTGAASSWVHVDGTWSGRPPATPWEMRITRPGEADAVGQLNWSSFGYLGEKAEGRFITEETWVLPRIDVQRRVFTKGIVSVKDPRRGGGAAPAAGAGGGT
jgi:hypothetical protein